MTILYTYHVTILYTYHVTILYTYHVTIYTYHVQIGLMAAVGAGLPIGKEVSTMCHCILLAFCYFFVLPCMLCIIINFGEFLYNGMVSTLYCALDTQGPFVHLACIIANLMNRIITTVNTVFSVSESLRQS